MRLSYSTGAFNGIEILQICLTIICVFLALYRAGFARGIFVRIEGVIAKIAERPPIAISILALLPILLRLLMLPVYTVPTPVIHDEFAYLLQADTVAHGRLTNPSHPLWKHFESIYVLSRPTYTGQYQPGQPLVLGAGQMLTGYPWAGVVVSMGVMCATVYWMLLAWFPARWAFFGGLLLICEFGVLSYWMNSYWGATVAAIGGMLIFGALPRLGVHYHVQDAILLALGFVILMNTRPSEAALLLPVAGGALLYWFLTGKKHQARAFVLRVVTPMALILTSALAWTGYYNYRVTGKATELPYIANQRMYGTPQGFFWQKPYIVHTSMPADVRMEYEDQLRRHARRHSVRELVYTTVGRTRTFWLFYIGIPLTIAFVFFPFIWRERNSGLLAAALLIIAFENLTFHAYFPQYTAAIFGTIIIVLLLCIRRMRASGPKGVFLSRSLPAVCVLALVIPMVGRFVQPVLPPQISSIAKLWSDEFMQQFPRHKFESHLEYQPGGHLVIVRYEYPAHAVGDEWVYNKADIDHAKIVWARELDPQSNQQLIRYFAGRKIWLAEPDAQPPRLTPLSPTNFEN